MCIIIRWRLICNWQKSFHKPGVPWCVSLFISWIYNCTDLKRIVVILLRKHFDFSSMKCFVLVYCMQSVNKSCLGPWLFASANSSLPTRQVQHGLHTWRTFVNYVSCDLLFWQHVGSYMFWKHTQKTSQELSSRKKWIHCGERPTPLKSSPHL
jgi:hypothetical protein